MNRRSLTLHPNTIAKFLAKKCGPCGAQVVPGEGLLGDASDVLCAIAPRPLLIQIGERDPGMALIDSQAPAEKVHRLYVMLGHGECCTIHLFPGGHEIDTPATVAWMRTAL